MLSGLCASIAAFERSATQLITTLHAAHLNKQTGSIQVPPRTQTVWVEVGGSDGDATLEHDAAFLSQTDAFLISYQPLLSRYVALLNRGRNRQKNDRYQPLGKHTRLGIVLPFAITTTPGLQNISVHDTAGCDRAGRACFDTEVRYAVEGITLDRALQLAGDSFPIARLNLPEGGVELLRNTSRGRLARLLAVLMEVRCSGAGCSARNKCSRRLSGEMASLGFDGNCEPHEGSERAAGQEARFLFVRRGNFPISVATGTERSTAASKSDATTTPLLARLQVANLREGRLSISSSTPWKQAFIEIGCSDFNTLDNNAGQISPGTLLLSFEPLVDKYASLLARGRSRHNLSDAYNFDVWPLGQHHVRGVVLPVAIGPEAGSHEITVTDVAGCSSLAQFNKGFPTKHFCFGAHERRLVETITLDTAVSMLPPAIPVVVKIDAQGLDLRVIEAASRVTLSRIWYVSMETRGDFCEPLYEGQVNCSTVQTRMGHLGYLPYKGVGCPPAHSRRYMHCEYQMRFVKPKPGATVP